MIAMIQVMSVIPFTRILFTACTSVEHTHSYTLYIEPHDLENGVGVHHAGLTSLLYTLSCVVGGLTPVLQLNVNCRRGIQHPADTVLNVSKRGQSIGYRHCVGSVLNAHHVSIHCEY